MNVSLNSVSDSAIINNIVINSPIMAYAPTLYILSNFNRADQKILGHYIINA